MEEEDVKGLSDYLAVIRRRKKQIIIPALIILLISIGLAFGLPPEYKSEATILIEQQEIPSDLVRSTVTSYAGERIQIISQRVMTTENLRKIIEKYDLYRDKRKQEPITTIVDEMREKIGLEMISADVVDPRSGRPTTATIAFKLSFADNDPRKAQKVANELVSLYLNENLKRRTESAVNTSSFLAEEADKLKQEVADLESQLAAFKERNINNLPEMQSLNLQLMERKEQEMRATDQRIRDLEERKIYLQAQLAQMSPTSDLYSTDGKRVLGAVDRLKALEAEYVGLKSRYSSNHPDVVKMQREIEALKRETGAVGDVNDYRRRLEELKGELASLRKRYSSQHPDVKKLQRAIVTTQAELNAALKEQKNSKYEAAQQPDNPAYIQLQSQLEAAESEMRSLKQYRSELKARIDDFEKRLIQSPQVEREYRTLVRDYESAAAKYQEVRAKQMEASLAESLERESKGERFSLIEPPQLPEKPDKPNRLAIIFLGFVLSIAGGIGTAAVAESMSEEIRSPKELVKLTGEPPLIVIPYITTQAEKRKRSRRRFGLVLLLLLLLAAAVAAFHFFIMPLDVAWYVIQRRLGIEVQ